MEKIRAVDDRPFKLEPGPKAGQVPEPVVKELERLLETSKDAAKDYADGVERQAKTHGVKKGALKRYVAARVADKVHDLEAETASLAKLLEAPRDPPKAAA